MDGASLIINALSTVVSAVALVGIMFALRLQLKQTRISQLQTFHAMHLEVMRLHMTNPSYRQVWGAVTAPTDSEVWSRNSYRNIVFMYYQMLLALEILDETGLKGQIQSLLATQEARDWWAKARPAYGREATTRLHARFISLVDEEWASLVRVNQQTSAERE